MWEPVDVVRSIQRYLSLMLEGPPWTIRWRREEVRDDQLPVAVISMGDLIVIRARETFDPQGEVEYLAPVTISAYPEVAANPKAAAAEAERVRGLLFRWVLHGLEVRGPAPDYRHWAGPFRIPLWDFEGVPLEGPDKVGPDHPHDVLWVLPESVTVQTVQDPDDTKRYGVFLNVRVTIEEPGRIYEWENVAEFFGTVPPEGFPGWQGEPVSAP